MSATKIKEGDIVTFYDCRQANIDRDYSGKNPKYYPKGKVVRIYLYKYYLNYIDLVCDLQVGDRISKGHFIRAVELCN